MKSVNPNTQIENPKIGEVNIDFMILGKNQWILVNQLDAEYKGKVVYGTNCLFEDDRWFNGEGRADESPINWNTLLNYDKPLTLLLKVVFFEMIRSRRLLIKTVISQKIGIFRKVILPIINGKNLLCGAEGEVLLGLNLITDDDLKVAIDALLISSYSEQGFIQSCYELKMLLEFINHVAESVPIYQTHARTPWQIAGIGPDKWAIRRAKELYHIFRKTVGYAPLVSETVNPIIEKSLELIYDLGDNFESMNQSLSFFDSQKGYTKYLIKNKSAAVAALEKYGSIFANIVASPNTQGLDSKQLISAVVVWLRELLYLARCACVNIILLTTGLRNIDIRGSQVNCCNPSKRVDILFYMQVDIEKTDNNVHLPVPEQTNRAVSLLNSIKFTKSPYLIDGLRYPPGTKNREFIDADLDSRVLTGQPINDMVRDFAVHFKIPFSSETNDSESSAHCYRTTVAGWLGSASALSILMVRRLFGHSNNIMPTVYLRNNPSFIKEREEVKLHTAAVMSKNMALAAASGQLAGVKGEQLEAGYKLHVSQFDVDKKKSHSLTDTEIITSFSKVLEQRFLDDSIFGFPTQFGVVCARNPNDTSQAPCARRSQRVKTTDIDRSLLDNLSAIDPANCIGASCKEAMIGPWSESIKETLLWHAKLLRHQLGDKFTEQHFQEQAIAFIRQYSGPIKKVFRIEVSTDGTVTDLSNSK